MSEGAGHAGSPDKARNRKPSKPDECPVCRSPYLSLFDVQQTPRGADVDVFFCMECESLSSPFSKPNPVQSSLDWHRSVYERNSRFSNAFLDIVVQKFGRPRGILDIGSGIGTLLKAAAERSISGVGYDLDTVSCQYGRAEFGLDLRGEEWSHGSGVGDVELIACIMVLEHIHYPRALMNGLMKEAIAKRCPIFVSVPFVEKTWWPHLLSDNRSEGHPFHYPHVHVTHFSRKGMKAAFTQMGARHFIETEQGFPWPGMFVLP